MPYSRGIIFGSIVGSLTILGIIIAITSLQLRPSGNTSLNDQSEDPLTLNSSSPREIEDRKPDSSIGQTAELEALAAAVQVMAGRRMHSLTLPGKELLDVINACNTDGQSEGRLGGILKALVALNGKTDMALALLRQLVISPQWNLRGPPITIKLREDITTLSVLLDDLSANGKRIVAQARSSTTGISRAEAVDAIQSAIQGFVVVNKLCIEDISALCASCELENNDALDQHSPRPNPTQSLALTKYRPDDILVSSYPHHEEPAGQDAVAALHRLGKNALDRYFESGSMDDLHGAINHFVEAFSLCRPEHHLAFEVHHDSGYAFFSRFQVLGQQEDLRQAIMHLRNALELCPQEEPNRHLLLCCLANALNVSFHQLGHTSHLDQSIRCRRDCLELISPKHSIRSIVLNNLAAGLKSRFDLLGQIADLQDSIIYNEEALELRPPGHPERHFSLGNIALALITRYNRLGQIADLQQSIVYGRDALELHAPGHPDRPTSLNNLALALSTRFAQLGEIVDLDQCIIYDRDALELCPPGHPNRSTSLNNLAAALKSRFTQLGQMADLEQSIMYQRDALKLCPPGHLDRHFSLGNLALALSTRFDQLGQMSDLEESISYNREALELRPPGHIHRLFALGNLALALKTRFARLGQISDLEQSIIYERDALEICPVGHPDRSGLLNNLAAALKTRFEQFGQMIDLEQSIICERDAVDLCPPGHPDRSTYLNNLAAALRSRFSQLGQMADLEQSILYQEEALKLFPPGHTGRHFSLGNLALALRTRFAQLGQITDLEQSIVYEQDTLDLRPPGHPARHFSLGNLASAFNVRFSQLGQMADLEQSIIYERDTLELCPPGHSYRSTSLNNLATALEARFAQLGQIDDLEQSIIHQQEALNLRPLGHLNRHFSLGNLALALKIRFDQLDKTSDLEQSIIYGRETLELRPPGHPHRSTSLGNLALALSARFAQSGQLADLEQSIMYNQQALELCPPGHLNRSAALHNLAAVLATRFTQLGQMADLEQSITYQRDALALRPVGHPSRSASLEDLARALQARFNRLGEMADLSQAVELLHSGANDASDTPAHRYICVSQLIALLEAYDHPLLLEVYQTALSLLQLVLAVYPNVELRREALNTNSLSPSLAMSAASYAIERGRPDKAVEMLEQGRSMLWSNIRGYREPVEGLRQVNSALADQFKAMSEQLEALATSSKLGLNRLSGETQEESATVSEARWARQRQLSLERDVVIQQIRQLDGFEHFLQAVPFNELQNASAEGAVVIVNVAQRRSDAIILYQRNAPVVLSLCADGQNREEAYLIILDLSKQLFETRGKAGFSKLLENTILKTLSELLVTSVLQELERWGVPPQSRIWWCPTSALCALPIHAAGELPNKFVSSYTPTLSALINARAGKIDDQQTPATQNVSDRKQSLLTVVYPGYPPSTEGGLDDRLLTVFTERNVIEKAGKASRACNVVRTDATRQTVLNELPKHSWMHFACHGRLNIFEPFRSHFELDDEPLSLSDLIQARLPDADFAFLAACDSATSGGTSNTPDESLHLAAAVQFCGVRSVVGTLWPMADEDGPKVAQVFYRHMFKENDPRKSADALQKVVTAMRKKVGPWKSAVDEGELLQRWANYIHIGA
ncbi:hypothetical protein HWV62_37203 [Athelia sp. TMB]|nr:hypothetical protein HWV62_37203 [Athelia sp. TMB]